MSESIAARVDKATSDTLLMPDWDLTLTLCDTVAASNDGSAALEASKALKKRLSNSNPKVVTLSVILAEALVKNGGALFQSAVTAKDFCAVLAPLAEGKKGPDVQSKALGLVQLLGVGLEPQRARHPHLFALFTDLKAKGYAFPPVDPSAVAVFLPPTAEAQQRHASTSGRASGDAGEALFVDKLSVLAQQYAKLRADLQVVGERIQAATALVQAGRASPSNNEWLDHVDFLEQCRLRLLAIINVGSTGSLEDDVFLSALELNEAICDVLAGKPSTSGPPAPTAAGGEADLLGLSDDAPVRPAAAPAPSPAAPSYTIAPFPPAPAPVSSFVRPPPLPVPTVSLTIPAPAPSTRPVSVAPAPAPVAQPASVADDFDAFIASHEPVVSSAGPAPPSGSSDLSALDDFFSSSAPPPRS